MKAKLKKIIKETPEVKTFVLELEEEIEFKSGQFISVKIPSYEHSKPFSISSPGEKSKEITFTCRIYKTGRFTEHLNNLKIGEELEIDGPRGHLFFDRSIKENIVLIGAGTGITTLHSIIRFIVGNKLKNKVSIVYSAKSPEEIIFKEGLERLSNDNKIDYFCTITKNDETWEGNIGRINRDILNKYNKNSRFYIVGPGEFVKYIFKTLINLNVNRENINMEIYGEDDS